MFRNGEKNWQKTERSYWVEATKTRRQQTKRRRRRKTRKKYVLLLSARSSLTIKQHFH